MSSTYAGNPALFPIDFPIPDDTDPPKAAAINPALEALGDRTANLNAAFGYGLVDYQTANGLLLGVDLVTGGTEQAIVPMPASGISAAVGDIVELSITTAVSFRYAAGTPTRESLQVYFNVPGAAFVQFEWPPVGGNLYQSPLSMTGSFIVATAGPLHPNIVFTLVFRSNPGDEAKADPFQSILKIWRPR